MLLQPGGWDRDVELRAPAAQGPGLAAMSRPPQYWVFWRPTASRPVSAEYVQVLVLTVTTSGLGGDVARFDIRMGPLLYLTKLPAHLASLGSLCNRALGLALSACHSLRVLVTAAGRAGLLNDEERSFLLGGRC